MKPVMNLDEVEFDDVEENGLYTSSRGQISSHIGAKQLGYNLTVLPPGKVQCPFHSHRGEEEMFFIVRGEGTLRYGSERRRIRAGDFICCPVGGPETAHQIINDSGAELAYISVSTMMPAEVCEYPDSGKIGAFGGSGESRLRHMTEASGGVDYWKGEE